MSRRSWRNAASLSPGQVKLAHRVDAACLDFERDWRSGARPRIESYLEAAHPSDRNELLRELVALEVELRQSVGERPARADYAVRFPDFASLVDTVLHDCLSTQAYESEPSAALDDGTVSPERSLPCVAGYDVLGKLGRGGMSVVYLARNVRLDRLCALKMIAAGEFADPTILARFRAEATTIARLRHSGIVQIYHVSEDEQKPYLELEYVEGGSLSARLDGTPWSPSEAARLIAEVAVAVNEAHRHGIVHRDLKPGNVLMGPDGQPKVSDFGLARLIGEDSELTRTHSILGTPCYMSPEQAGGNAHGVGPAADVHALGAILYELLTGRPPFHGTSVIETVEQVKTLDPVAPSRFQPGIPCDLETICLTCLHKEPERRYSSAFGLAEDLSRFQRGEPILARRAGWFEHARTWVRRNPTRAVLAAVSALLVLVLTLGPVVSSFAVLRARAQTGLAEQLATDHLRGMLMAKARTLRLSNQPGRRYQSLNMLAEAAKIRPGKDLRDEAIACLRLVDLRLDSQWPIRLPSFSRPAVSWRSGRYAISDDSGNLAIRSLGDNRLLFTLSGSGERSHLLQFSSYGRHLIAAYDDGFHRIWDLERREALSWVPVGITACAFRPDDRAVALGLPGGAISICELADGAEVARFHVGGSAAAISFAPDANWLAVARDRVVDILDTTSGRILASLTHGSEPFAVCWGNNGRLLATLSRSDHLRVFESLRWKEAWSELPLESAFRSAILGPAKTLSFSPNGEILACESLDGIHVHDAWTGELHVSAAGRLFGAPDGTAFSPDGRRLLTITDDRTQAQSWEVGRCAELSQPLRYSASENGITFSVDFRSEDSLLAVGEQRGTRLIDSSNGAELHRLQTGHTECVRFAPDGSGFVAAGYYGLSFWPIQARDQKGSRDYTVGPPRTLYPNLSTSHTWRVAWTDDGRTLAWSDRPRGEVLLSNVNDSQGIRIFDGIESLVDLDISPDGRWFVTCPWYGTAIEVRNTRNGEIVWRRATTKSEARFSPDSRLLATVDDDRITVLDTGSWQVIRVFPLTGASTLAFSPDNRWLAVAGPEGAVHIIDAQKGEMVATFQSPDPKVNPLELAFSSDGTRLALAMRERGVQVWDLEQVQRTLDGIGLAWIRPRSTPRNSAVVAGGVELREPKTDARLAEHKGDWSRAVSLRTELIEADPADHAQWLRRGHDRVQIGDWSGALEDFERASGVERNSGALFSYVGRPTDIGATWNGWKPVPGRWYHIAVTFDDEQGVMRGYVDGSMIDFNRTRQPPGYDGHPLSIGALVTDGRTRSNLAGQVTDIRLFRIARSQRDLQADADGRNPGRNTSDLVGQWNAEPHTIGSLIDRSGHDQKALLVGDVVAVPAPVDCPVPGYVLQFGGAEGRVDILDSPLLRNRSFTVQAWFSFTTADRDCWLFSRGIADSEAVSFALQYDYIETADELEVRHAQALALLSVADQAGYQSLCEQLVPKFVSTQKSELAAELLRIVTLAPSAVKDFGPCVSLARSALANQESPEALQLLGAVLYRAGQLEDSALLLKRVVTMDGGENSPHGQLFRSMALSALGDRQQAHALLDNTEHSIPRALRSDFDKRSGEHLPDDWMLPAELYLLRTEAAKLLLLEERGTATLIP